MLIGVDPGSRTSGLAVLQAGKLAGATLIGWDDGDDWASHSAEIVDTIDMWLNQIGDVTNGAGPPIIRVEDVVPPTPHVGPRPISVAPILTTAKIVGYLMARWPSMVQLVAPARHGQRQPFRTCYPPELIGPRETTGTSGRYRHVRAAYDIALTPGVSLWRD